MRGAARKPLSVCLIDWRDPVGRIVDRIVILRMYKRDRSFCLQFFDYCKSIISLVCKSRILNIRPLLVANRLQAGHDPLRDRQHPRSLRPQGTD